MNDVYIPPWLQPGNRVDEVAFAQEYLANHPLRFQDGAFFTQQGRLTDPDQLRREVYEEISPYLTRGVITTVDRLVDTLRMEARGKPVPLQEMVIHLQNGAYHLSEGFLPGMTVCRHRLPVCYTDSPKDPQLWLDFLNQLLQPEDIPTLQEYMGYCLVPVTCAQKMLLIVGGGGEGKSRVGLVMHALLGDAMVTGSIAKVEMNPFARADLEHRLLMVDDDLRLEGLPQTHYLKTIISAEGPMDLERKGKQSYQGKLYCRLMAFGNDTLQSLYDHSYGFYRRQLILKAKPRPKDRVDDPYLAKRLIRERDDIFLWAIEGLIRLIGNDFRFTVSDASQALMQQNMHAGSSILGFLDAQGYVRPDPMGKASTRQLYQRYRDWCEDNAAEPMPIRSFTRALEQQTKLPLTYTTNVPIGNGKHARGYQGLRLCSGF